MKYYHAWVCSAVIVPTAFCSVSSDVCLLICISRPDAAYDVPDRRTGRQGLAELRKLNSRRQWNFVEVSTLLFTYSLST